MLLDWFNFRDFLLFFLVFTPLEHLIPIKEKSLGFRRGWLTDVCHFFLSGIFIRIGLTVVIVMAAEIGASVVPASLSGAVQSMQIWIQVLLAILIVFGKGNTSSIKIFFPSPYSGSAANKASISSH